jgi:hypothetical protein
VGTSTVCPILNWGVEEEGGRGGERERAVGRRGTSEEENRKGGRAH